mmetsp:Transcript_64843/g.135190  ORF Transcript_64843/g.135190 Transcript_64843/m.135190 type:complete len:214 (-) Transcript_64843:849-1490(-)
MLLSSEKRIVNSSSESIERDSVSDSLPSTCSHLPCKRFKDSMRLPETERKQSSVMAHAWLATRSSVSDPVSPEMVRRLPAGIFLSGCSVTEISFALAPTEVESLIAIIVTQSDATSERTACDPATREAGRLNAPVGHVFRQAQGGAVLKMQAEKTGHVMFPATLPLPLPEGVVRFAQYGSVALAVAHDEFEEFNTARTPPSAVVGPTTWNSSP